MTTHIEDCPCTGKSMSNLSAPWLLLTLYHQDGIHGYEITKIIRLHIERMGVGLNMAGLYRHLKVLEERGMLRSQWDTTAKGPARRKYYLTEAGKQCLWHWMQTLTTQMALIGQFFDFAGSVLPNHHWPTPEKVVRQQRSKERD